MTDSLFIKRTLTSGSPEATQALGAALGRAIAAAPVDRALLITLNGDLGAGKTTFVGGLVRALGAQGPVRSPTYTLIEQYDLPDMLGRSLYHLDLYRLADASELEMLAPRDLLEPGAALLVEWAEKGGRALPPADLSLTFSYPGELAGPNAAASKRGIEINPGSSVGSVLAASLHQLPNDPELST